MGRVIDHSSSYGDKLAKLIPAEIIAAYIAIRGLVLHDSTIRETALITSGIILIILIPFYLIRIHHVQSKFQIIITCLSFVVWVFSVSIADFSGIIISPAIGTVVLILWTTIVPIIQYGD